MLTKTTNNKALFIAALLLIIPIMLSANGVQEGGNLKASTLDIEAEELLTDVKDGKTSVEDAKLAFIAIGKEYKLDSEQGEQLLKMVDDVKSGEKSIQQCMDKLPEQTRTRSQTRKKEGTGEQTQTRLERGTDAQTQTVKNNS